MYTCLSDQRSTTPPPPLFWGGFKKWGRRRGTAILKFYQFIYHHDFWILNIPFQNNKRNPLLGKKISQEVSKSFCIISLHNFKVHCSVLGTRFPHRHEKDYSKFSFQKFNTKKYITRKTERKIMTLKKLYSCNIIFQRLSFNIWYSILKVALLHFSSNFRNPTTMFIIKPSLR